MITFMSGTPGSGKSLQAAQTVEFWMRTLKKNVLANVQYNRTFISRGKRDCGRFFYIDNLVLTPDVLYKYALKHHVMGKESQSLLVIDEAQTRFSPTAVKLFTQENKFYRQEWLDFFTQHRHLGYDILIISQFDRLIDAQVRCLFEYNYVHRKVNNFRSLGKILTIFKVQAFMQVQYWYGAHEKCGSKLFFYKRKYSKIYDSYGYRDKIVAKLKVKYGEDFVLQLLDPRAYAEKVKSLKQERLLETAIQVS